MGGGGVGRAEPSVKGGGTYSDGKRRGAGARLQFNVEREMAERESWSSERTMTIRCVEWNNSEFLAIKMKR